MTRGPQALPPSWLVMASLIPFVLVALPIGYVIVQGWQAGVGGILQNLIRPYTLNLLLNTLTIAVSVTVLAGLIAIAAAWGTERCDLPGRRWWRLAVALPLAIPAYVSSFAWSSLGPWFQEIQGAILILTFYSVPLVYLPVVAALRSLDPNFEDVARSLGHGRWRTFRRVVLPQIAPALGGSALLVAAHMLAEFGALSFLRVETFTTAIFDQYTAEFNNQAAALLSGVLMLICLPVAFAEARMRTRRRVARIGRGSARALVPIALGPLMPLAILGFVLLTILSFGVPIVTLGFWVWQGHSAGQGIERVLPALATTLGYALPGAVLTTIAAVPLVIATTHFRGRFAMLCDRLPYIVHGLPGIVVALAAVATAIGFLPAVYQTSGLVLLVYLVLFLPLAQSSVRASAELVPRELSDVARSLGKTPFQAFVLTILPNLLPGIGAALALTALQLMRELTATLLLAPAGVVTLATEFWNYTSDRAYGAAAPFAATLVLVSGIPVYVFTMRTLRLNDVR
ncbi:MAG TPA: iron ABC transporter permease [Aliidongia sp.]|uniref:ABC transporter permease n=1 Tax=Aliidongia sp. TaxID=1914230 RepID=UPI002DDD8BB1|nr:iron ABC transporter permease [Aliidongia sp.]HEV2675239.1 iron ABC transporter permease [Aliidongia sp.]